MNSVHTSWDFLSIVKIAQKFKLIEYVQNEKTHICYLGCLFTPQPSGLEGYCRHGPGAAGGRTGGRSGGRLPDLRNPYLCNRLMDFLHSKFYGIV